MLLLPAALADMVNVDITCGINGNVIPKGKKQAAANTDFDLTATPNPGYVVDWYVNGAHAGWTDNHITLHLGDTDVAVDVEFLRITNQVHVSAGSEGKVFPVGNSESLGVAWGDSANFSAQPDPHYHVDTWAATMGSSVTSQSGGNSFSLPNVTAEAWLVLMFTPDIYTIDATALGHGTLSPTGAVQVAYADDQTFTAVPEAGYDLIVWTLDGTKVLTNQTVYTLTSIQTNHTLQVSFSQPQLAITRTATNSVLLSWPNAMSNYTLQETSSLAYPNWTNSTLVVTDLPNRQQVIITNPVVNRFFRLAQ